MGIEAVEKELREKGFNVEEARTKYGRTELCVRFVEENFEKGYREIRNLLKNKKDLCIKSYFYSNTVSIMNKADYEYVQRHNQIQAELVEKFWQAKHMGKGTDDAVAEQRAYAEEHGYMEDFNLIYQ